MFWKKPEIIDREFLLKHGFEERFNGTKPFYEREGKYGYEVKIYPYVTESHFDFFWTVNGVLYPDLKKEESNRVLTVIETV